MTARSTKSPSSGTSPEATSGRTCVVEFDAFVTVPTALTTSVRSTPRSTATWTSTSRGTVQNSVIVHVTWSPVSSASVTTWYSIAMQIDASDGTRRTPSPSTFTQPAGWVLTAPLTIPFTVTKITSSST